MRHGCFTDGDGAGRNGDRKMIEKFSAEWVLERVIRTDKLISCADLDSAVRLLISVCYDQEALAAATDTQILEWVCAENEAA